MQTTETRTSGDQIHQGMTEGQIRDNNHQIHIQEIENFTEMPRQKLNTTKVVMTIKMEI